MSKSDDNPNNFVLMLEEPKKIAKKLKRAVTDSDERAHIYYDPDEKAGISNLLSILSCATGKHIDELVPHYEDKMYGHLKTDTADAVVALLEPIQQRFKEWRADEAGLQEVMKIGAEKASERAAATLAKVYDRIGLIAKP